MLKKGLSLLEALGEHPDGVGVSRVANDAALPVSTTYRLLNDLVASCFASFDPETRRYYLGLKVFELSSRVSLTKGLSDVALPVMRRLSKEVGESVFMGVREGTDILIIEKVIGPGRIQVNDNVGSRIPLHRLAQGKSILAFLPEDECEELIDNMILEPETPRTITDQDTLRDELEITRKRGWASVDGENEEWVRAIATPILGARDLPVAAFAVAFLGNAALWWTYFARSARDASEAIARSADPGRMTRSAYVYFHVPIVAGIIAVAAADELVLAHPGEAGTLASVSLILGGTALFLAGHGLFS